MTIHAVTTWTSTTGRRRNAAGDRPGRGLDHAEDADQAPDDPDGRALIRGTFIYSGAGS